MLSSWPVSRGRPAADRSGRRCASGSRRRPPAGGRAYAGRPPTARPRRRPTAAARSARCGQGRPRRRPGGRRLPRATRPSRGRTPPGTARPIPGRRGVARALPRARSTRRTACPARPAVGRGRTARPDRPDPRSGGSRRPVPAAGRRSGCPGRGSAPSGWHRPGGSRSTARSRDRAASCRTARPPTAGTVASGATCRRPSCCSRRHAGPGGGRPRSSVAGPCSRDSRAGCRPGTPCRPRGGSGR